MTIQYKSKIEEINGFKWLALYKDELRNNWKWTLILEKHLNPTQSTTKPAGSSTTKVSNLATNQNLIRTTSNTSNLIIIIW